MNNIFAASLKYLLLFFIISSCTSYSQQESAVSPSWYITPKQNNIDNLYGVAEGFTLEEATKYALADAASRLMVSISSESSLIREENNVSTNEELRQQVAQKIEKINFVNFKTSKSEKFKNVFFVEVQIERLPFIDAQKENLKFLEKQISDLKKNPKENLVQKRNSLLKILDLEKQSELSSRILIGLGVDINLNEKLSKIADYQKQLNLISDKIEFYFEINSPKEIAKIIRKSLNREKIKIASTQNKSNQNQVEIRITSESKANNIYESYITKLKVDFENLSGEKIIASNSIEAVGSSSISEKESYFAALSALEEKIEKEGILKILGIN